MAEAVAVGLDKSSIEQTLIHIVEDLTQDHDPAGALDESSKRDVAGGEGDGVRLDRGDTQDRDENPSAGEQFDDQSEHAGLVAHDADADHHTADPAQGLAVGAQHHHSRQSRRVYPVHRRHDYKG